jgi:hypothetical protein
VPSAKKGTLYALDLRRNDLDEIWFRFALNVAGDPKFEVWDLVPALRKTLTVGGNLPAGEYSTRGRAMFWDRQSEVPARLASGVYFLKFYVGSSYQTQVKFTLD